MNKTIKTIIAVFFLLVIIAFVGTFISSSKFSVSNPLSTAKGLFQVVINKEAYVEIQEYPKVILARPDVSLRDYMISNGFQEDTEGQADSLHKFQSSFLTEYVSYSTNEYFSKWIWQE